MKFNGIQIVKSATTIAAALMVVGCGLDPQSPGFEYMPDMYRTQALEPYAGNSNFADSMEARLPAEGSIPLGYLPYGLPNTPEGYEMAGTLLKNPLPNSEDVIEDGKVIYSKYCVHCHGKEGQGDGLTVTAGGHPPPPAYSSAALVTLAEGKMFHTITYGRNLMGSHASQLNAEERWKVIRYVQTLQNPKGDEEAAPKNNAAETSPATPLESTTEATEEQTSMTN